MKEKFTEQKAVESKELPKALYHASPRRDLEEIRPGRRTMRDPSEGSAVFAAPDRAVASMFLFESDGSWVMSE
jgi:hypothetical protein